MKNLLKISILALIVSLASCGEKTSSIKEIDTLKKDTTIKADTAKKDTTTVTTTVKKDAVKK